jgi:chromosome segregation ATPase
MPTSALYWIALIALAMSVLFSLLRRQTAARLATALRQLDQERKDRERLTGELLRRETSRAAAEKEALAAKKEAADRLAEDAASLAQASGRIDALEAELKEVQDRLGEARATEEETARAAKQAKEEAAASAKKLAEEAKLREALDSERAALKAKLDEEEARSAELERLRSAAHERAKKLEEEIEALRAQAAATPVPTSTAIEGGGVLAALDADPLLNRGQKETLRMTYQQFTTRKRSS